MKLLPHGHIAPFTDAWICANTPDPSGGRGEMAMSRLYFLHSDFCQDVDVRCSECPHRCSASGCRVSFQPHEGNVMGHGSDEGFQRRETQAGAPQVEYRPNGAGATSARKGSRCLGGIFQAMRPVKAQWSASPPAALWELTSGHLFARATNPRNWRATDQAPAGTNPTTGQAAITF